jgi:hypothetical protein
MNKTSAIQPAGTANGRPCARPSGPDRRVGLSEIDLGRVAAGGGKGYKRKSDGRLTLRGGDRAAG